MLIGALSLPVGTTREGLKDMSPPLSSLLPVPNELLRVVGMEKAPDAGPKLPVVPPRAPATFITVPDMFRILSPCFPPPINVEIYETRRHKRTDTLIGCV
jgi:hypothetical protein